ncbi:MAG: protein BatD [Ignavibacteriae bacterium]|nr:protein BatD [Ignavibacteria bacterium]MBI3364359.1 protein BatD [Ignavibacteriota bacterium]
MRQIIRMHVILCVLLLPLRASSQDGSFVASVDRTAVAIGEQFELTFTLNGTGSGNNFRPPTMNDFVVLSGPIQSTSMQFVNGAVSSSVSYSYSLRPRAEGKFVIAAATITYGGKQLQTQIITITVTKGTPQQKQQNQQSQDADVGRQIGDNIFLKVSVDKSRVYQGEQITATYKLYTRLNVANYNVTKMPALTGFWSEDLTESKQVQLTTEVVNGKQYRVGVLKKVALFPQRAGALEIDPMEVTLVVQMQTRRRSNDIFDQFFNDPFFGGLTNVSHAIASEPVKITVSPLPSNAPNGFAGAVGKFSMETWLDKRQTKTNEPVTLKVKITGRGNLKLLGAPAITIPPDLEKYDPKISDNVANQGTQIAGSRTFEYLLIPRHAGEQKIPAFPFAYFDVDKKSYATLASPEFVLAVEKGLDVASSSSVAGISKEDVKLLGEDIRFIKSGNITLNRKGESFVGTTTFFALSFTPILGFVGFIFYARKREKVLRDVAGLRNKKARKMAQRRLVQAKHFLDQKKKVDDSTRREEFYAEISRALWGYVGDKLGIPPADLSLDGVKDSLAVRQVPPDAVSKLSSTIEQCEFARFAPSTDSLQMESIYNESIELISTIEDHIR